MTMADETSKIKFEPSVNFNHNDAGYCPGLCLIFKNRSPGCNFYKEESNKCKLFEAYNVFDS